MIHFRYQVLYKMRVLLHVNQIISNHIFLEELLLDTKIAIFTVSSLHMEWIWVPNMTAVKVRNRKPSRHKKIIRITVTGGEKSLHSVKTTHLIMKKNTSTEHVHSKLSPLQ